MLCNRDINYNLCFLSCAVGCLYNYHREFCLIAPFPHRKTAFFALPGVTISCHREGRLPVSCGAIAFESLVNSKSQLHLVKNSGLPRKRNDELAMTARRRLPRHMRIRDSQQPRRVRVKLKMKISQIHYSLNDSEL